MPTGGQVDSIMEFAAGLILFALGLLVLRRSPKLAIVSWAVIITFVPVWIGVQVHAYFPAATLISLFCALSLLPVVRALHWSSMDLVFIAILVAVLVEKLLHLTTLSATFDLTATWATAYVVGRLVVEKVPPEWVYRAIAVVFTAAAVFAIVEFLTGTNLFVTHLASDTRLYEIWGTLQSRGGVIRADGAFGHSIALGASLAVGVSLALGSSLRPVIKIPMVIVMSAAAVLTFSRTGMFTCALAILLACLFQRHNLSRVVRIGLALLTALAGYLAFTLVQDVFLSSGNEAQNSAWYRSELLDLINAMSPFGVSSSYTVSTTHRVSIGDFGSIDNALLLFGLIYGWVLLVSGLVALLYTLRRRATPAVLAVVAQVPAFVTVALVTQYASVVWFAAGLAVGTQVLADRRAAQQAAVTEPPLVLTPLPTLVSTARPREATS